ncbi:MAG TPA: hypothetical protein VLA77_02175 [Candidatus Saccharimonadales bacterium]|nr:hypothetical protein [Candidatus Saccharimonadales bacterium]
MSLFRRGQHCCCQPAFATIIGFGRIPMTNGGHSHDCTCTHGRCIGPVRIVHTAANCTCIDGECDKTDYDRIQQMIDAATAPLTIQITTLTSRLDEAGRRIEDLEARPIAGITEVVGERRSFVTRWTLVGAIIGFALAVIGALSVPEGIYHLLGNKTWFYTQSFLFWMEIIIGTTFIVAGLGFFFGMARSADAVPTYREVTRTDGGSL